MCRKAQASYFNTGRAQATEGGAWYLEETMKHYLEEDAVAAFTKQLYENEKSPSTIRQYTRELIRFRDWLGENREVTKSRVVQYKQELGQRYQLSSANAMLSALNTFFRIRNWDDCRIRTYRVQRASFRSEQRELSRSEYRSLVETAREGKDPQLAMIMETIANTGIRISELRFITAEALSRRRAQVHLKGKSREVLLPTALCRRLRAYCREHQIRAGSIFVTRTGRPVDRSTVLHRMKALSHASGVPREKIFPHNLRHFFAVSYYRAEKDIVRLADILGHSNINTTRIYTMVSCEAELTVLDKVERLIATA